jgi:hypothetical protein
MKPRSITFLLMVGLILAGTPVVTQAATRTRKPPESDLASADIRRASVDLALSLAKQEMPGPLPDALPQPFNPTGFNRVAREEQHPAEAGASAPAKALGDRELLVAIAAHITPSGTFSIGGVRRLQFGKKHIKLGDHLTVTHEGQDYILELTAIDATNFTLRLNREEITRPIKPAKNP